MSLFSLSVKRVGIHSYFSFVRTFSKMSSTPKLSGKGDVNGLLLSSVSPVPVSVSDPEALHIATRGLLEEKVIAVPTDTIYGVAGLAQSSSAVQKLYAIKKRSHTKPIAICVAEIDDIYNWADVTVERALLEDLLPGPVTIVLRRAAALNAELNPGTELVGVRIPDHRFIRQLCAACGQPLALTSANESAEQSTVSVEEFRSLWLQLAAIVDGGLLAQGAEARAGSTVVDLSRPGCFRVIRDGSALEITSKVLQGKYGLEPL